jgi:hypothetical protein
MSESNKPQLHMSRVNRILKCGQQDYYISVEGLRMPPDIRLVVGTNTHKTVEANLKNKIETGELLPVEQVKDMAADLMTQSWDTEEIRMNDGEDMSVQVAKSLSKDKAIALSELHALLVAPMLLPKTVERKWVIRMPNYPMDLAGQMDIEETTGAIRDTKTAAKSPTEDAALIDDKLDMYGLAKKVIDGVETPRLYLDYLIHYITPKKQETVTKTLTLETTPTPERTRRTLAKVERVMEIIEKGVYTPAPPDHWICSKRFCGFHSICPFWSGK